MAWLTAIASSLAPWVRAFFEALLPFLRTEAQTPVQRTSAEQDRAVQQEVQDAIDAYDHEHERAGAD